MVFVLFPSSKLPENRSIPAVTKGLKSGDRIGRAQYDGRSKIERNEIFFMTVMAAERIGTSASRTLYSVREAVLGSPILLFDRHHPSVPTCAQSVPSRAAAVKDGPSSGHRFSGAQRP